MSRVDQSTTLATAFLGLGILFSAALMVAAARGDLWFDEIWSIFFAESARTPWQIVSVYKHDNNHVLNTLFVYLVGQQSNLIVYRALAIASGIGSMVTLVSIARKWGTLESILVLVLAGTSYPLVLYFSEARGYAPAMCFALLSLMILQSSLSRPNRLKTALFWVVTIGGILSHLTFMAVLLSLFVFTLIHCSRTCLSLKTTVLRVSEYFLVPLLFTGAFYFFYARDMVIGGGNINNKTSEIAKGVGYLLGMPDSLHAGWLALVLFAVAVLLGVYLLHSDKDAAWSFFISVLILSPALMLLVTRPTYFWFRYFVVCFPFFYLLLSFMMGRLYRGRHKAYRYLIFGVLCLYLLGQAQNLVPLIRLGRGNYRAIIAYVSDNSPGNVLTIGSDHDFRNNLLLSFYARFLPPQKPLYYVGQASLGREVPEWMITHSLDPSYDPPQWIAIPGNQMYELAKVERFAGNSGFSWFLYHHESDQIGAPQG